MIRVLTAVFAVILLAATTLITTAGSRASSCEISGTWVAYAHRINGGEMKLAGNSLLIANETHWARVEQFDDFNHGSAGAYEIRGDSITWHYTVGGSRGYSETCSVDDEGLHTTNRVTEPTGAETLRETDYRRVE